MWIIENLLRVANNSQLQQPSRPGNAWEWDHVIVEICLDFLDNNFNHPLLSSTTITHLSTTINYPLLLSTINTSQPSCQGSHSFYK